MNLAGAQVIIRADASPLIGTGHVVRMLALADALGARGASTRFVCRAGPGDMLDVVRERGYRADALPAPPAAHGPDAAHQDAAATRACLPARVDLLACDHYGLDHRWHRALRDRAGRILAVDDLATRSHDCDVLLDHNAGRRAADYDGLVPAACVRLVGPAFALLRPGFAEARMRALARRERASGLSRVLVSMGGADLPDSTSRVLESLAGIDSPAQLQVDVVMGRHAPRVDAVRQLAAASPMRVTVHVDVADMASLMVEADLAIGAGGGTSLERCCLALPSLLVVIADNQLAGSRALADAGAALLLGSVEDIATSLPAALSALRADPERLRTMAHAAGTVADGLGALRVVDQLERL